MKYLIFSDSHLNDFFDERKFNFLKRIILNSDRVIINGDFWEAYDLKINSFISSKWNKLFKYLKKNNSIYLFGNHDKKTYAEGKASMFSIKQEYKIKIKSGNKIFFIEHGDKITPLWDKYFKRVPRFLNRFLNSLEKTIIAILGMNAIGILYKKFNDNMKKKKSSVLKNNEYLVCGHTHWMEFDEKNHYINLGFIKHGIGQYVTIENGKVEFHNEKY